MALRINGKLARVHWLTNRHNDGRLLSGQGFIYITESKKLGQGTANTYVGLTPGEAFEKRYSGQKANLDRDWVATDIFVYELNTSSFSDADDGIRTLINELYAKKQIDFSANVGSIQTANTNAEALINYIPEIHLDTLINVVKQYFGIKTSFITKEPIIWRWKQEEDSVIILDILKTYGICLHAAYTGRGKTKISIEVATRLLKTGGIVLVTTPITDTKKSFEENIRDYHFGNNRNIVITYMDGTEFSKYSASQLAARAKSGELIFVCLTVQDLRYDDKDPNANAAIDKLRKKYQSLGNAVDLWIRDERHLQYEGEITKDRLEGVTAKYELDLTATPYNVMEQYQLEHIHARTLLWGLQNKENTNLPNIKVDAINTLIENVSSRLKGIFSTEEGFDPRKLFVMENEQFVFLSELLEIRDKMYHDTLSKKKNPLSIINDTGLDAAAKHCGMWVLPEGQNGVCADFYIPRLASLINAASKTKFVDSYTVEKTCKNMNITVGEHIDSLVEEHGRVVILTCGKFLTGTDIPALGHIVLMSKMNNVANFEQLLGRMTRNYERNGNVKENVKLYAFAPASDIGLVLGQMAKKNAQLSNTQNEYDILDCIPLTEYRIGEATRISPTDILQDVQEFFRNLAKGKLPINSLQHELAGMDLTAFTVLDGKRYNSQTPKTSLADANGAKVKNKLTTNPKTGKPRTKGEIQAILKVIGLLQSVMVEARWVSYIQNNYSPGILSDDILVKMFGTDLDLVNALVKENQNIKDMVQKVLVGNQLAFKGLDLEEVSEDIFMNTSFKQSIGLVYTSFELAKHIVDLLPKNKYNKKNATILVFNALNGSFPLMLREKYPNARIICAEYHPYFEGHLAKLGFEVTQVFMSDGKLRLAGEYDNMKFDVVVGNPPFQATTESEKGNTQGDFWYHFLRKSADLVVDGGYIGLVTPKSWCGIGNYRTTRFKFDFFRKNTPILINFDVNKHFKVGIGICYYIIQKGRTGVTKVKNCFGLKEIDLSKVDVMPFIPDSVSISVTKKILDKNSKKTYNFTEGSHKNAGKPKVAIIRARFVSPEKIFVDESGNDDTKYKTSMPLRSTEISGAKNVFNSKLVKYFFTIMGGPAGQSQTSIMKNLPILDLTRPWTDQEIYDHFGLTQEEIDYIEANVK